MNTPRNGKTVGPEPQLSVCIPTLNRAEYVEQLLQTLLLLLGDQGITFEIVVSDSCSDDETSAMLARQRSASSKIVAVRTPQRTDHAEDNVLFLLRHASGRYVWLLGDDDDVVPSSVASLVRLVKDDQVDLAIFNSRSHDFYGRPLKDIRIPCNASHLDMTMRDFVARTGFWFVLSGFSTTLFKREVADVGAFARMLATSRIYSVATWLVQQFWEARVRFVNVPLVSYRQNLSDVAPTADDIEELRRERARLEVSVDADDRAVAAAEPHWTRVARIENTFERGIWTNKFLEQIDVLCDTCRMERAFLTHAVDRSLDDRFVFSYEVLKHFVEQLERWSREGPSHGLTQDQFSYFVDWAPYLALDHGSVSILLRRALRTKFAGDEDGFGRALRSLRSVLNELLRRPWYYRYHLTELSGYKIYAHGGVWAAAHISRPDLAQMQFRYLDPSSIRPFFLAADSENDLYAAIEANLPEVQHSQRLEAVRVQNASEISNAVVGLSALLMNKLEVVASRIEQLAASAPAAAARDETPTSQVASSEAQENFSVLLRDFGTLFDAEWYAEQVEALGVPERPKGADLLRHFEQAGSRAGRDPNPWFDERWYLGHYPDAREKARAGQVVSGFHYYLRSGYALGHDPSPRFSEIAYLAANRDVAEAVADPETGVRSGFVHWVEYGQHEGRVMGQAG